MKRDSGHWRGLRRVALTAALAAFAAVAQAQAQSPAASASASATRDWLDWSTWSSWWPWRGDATPPPPTGVQSPFYGDALFYFFQGRYFTSVSQLMVSQQFGRVNPHDDEAEVLRGGLFLSYGLHREAGVIFARLIERNAAPPVRDRAWFYLAKIRYQRGLYAEAQDALAHIGNPLPGALQDERTLLQANLLMTQGRYADAVASLDAVARQRGASQYVRYNLGVALIRSGDVARGTALLDEVGKLQSPNEEFRSLRDKANVALGFAALQEDRPEQARAYLERVRLNGMESNKALLGFGWAAASSGRMKVALVPWDELAKREATDSAVLEAKLAVPYALAELGASAQALAQYEDAIAAFDRADASLDRSIKAVRDGGLVDTLVQRNLGAEMGWFWTIAELPDLQELPHARQLAPLLASHAFQEAFKNYHDLRFLEGRLRQWQDSLAVLRDMLANRRAAFEERLPTVREKERGLDVAARGARVQSLTGELQRVERERDVAAFATPRERELQARLDRVRTELDRVAADPAFAEARERYRRASGALLWQQSDQFAARLWNAKKGAQVLEREVAMADARDAALARAQRDEPARLEAFARRIDALEARVVALTPRVERLAQEQREVVQDLAVAALRRQKEQLAELRTQARFAVAQIYDRASVAKEGGRAGTR